MLIKGVSKCWRRTGKHCCALPISAADENSFEVFPPLHPPRDIESQAMAISGNYFGRAMFSASKSGRIKRKVIKDDEDGCAYNYQNDER